MEELIPILAVVLGLLLRVAIPIAVTLTFIKVLKWFDQRWQREADLKGISAARARNIGCWDINNCPEEQRAECKAYANPDKPCWQVFRETDGRLQERCIGCDIFKHAPAPVTT